MISNKAFPLGVDFPVSGENVCEADKRGAACKAVAKISDFCRMRGKKLAAQGILTYFTKWTLTYLCTLRGPFC